MIKRPIEPELATLLSFIGHHRINIQVFKYHVMRLDVLLEKQNRLGDLLATLLEAMQ